MSTFSETNDVFAKLAGGVAVITGAGGGLGSGLARQTAALGMKVVVADIAFRNAQEVASKITSEGGRAEAVAVDVSKPEELNRLADYVHSKYGNVRLLINNAGIETLGLCWEVSSERLDTTLNVNIHGVAHGVRAFLPRMIESKQECWVANVSSIGAFGGVPTQSVYIMTKHAVQAFTEGLYLDVQGVEAPIHVSAVIPGLLRTGIFDGSTGSLMPNDEMTPLQKYRREMAQLADEHGMEVDEASRMIINQIAEGKFWVSTHPEILEDFISRRVSFLSNYEFPEAPPGPKTLFDF